MPSNEVKKKIEEIKRGKREPMPTDEELKKKANQILCCVYTVVKGEEDRDIFENDVIKEVDKYYNTNYRSDLPRDVLQYLEDSGFIVLGRESKAGIALTKLGIKTVEESSICDN